MARTMAIGLCAIFLALGAGRSDAQTYRVTAGEHPDFSRIVIQMPPETQWSIASQPRLHHLTISPPMGSFDISRLFERIPRTRLLSAQAAVGGLNLTTACDCEIRAWQERPGLVVIDLSNPDPADLAAQQPAVPARTRDTETQRLETARAAGATLAQSHSDAQQRQAQMSIGDPAPPVDTIMRSLGLPIAQALSQGLLEPAGVEQTNAPVLLPGTADLPGDLPENMRITSATDRADPNATPQDETAAICQGAEALAFLKVPPTEPFDIAFGRLTRALYGEFDQPDPNARLGMIELYLASGFGAEARALIANESASMVGRDLLLGFSDILEDRNSNSRMRLAQMTSCSGPASVLAVLAGAHGSEVLAAGPEIALNFTELGAPLRATLSADLVTKLIDAQALDAARVVAGSAGRSPWMSPNASNVIDAQLDRARGFPNDAIARLDHAQMADSASVLARMRLSLETGNPIPLETLEHAESLATTERSNSTGSDLLSAAIKLYARSGAFERSFAALERLDSWIPQHRHSEPEHQALRDVIWAAIGQNGDDPELMRAVLSREDWRSPNLALQTRQTLARRLLDLGLGQQVLELLSGADDTASTELLARAYVDRNQPERAMNLVSDLETVAARRTRARAFATLGHPEAAAQEFDAISEPQEARRNAISARDWDRVQQAPDVADIPYDVGQIGQIMRFAPGHLETVLQSIPDGAASQQPVSSNAPGEDVATRLDTPEPQVGAPLTEGTTGIDATSAPSPTAEAASFDRLGLVTRSATLLDESARLRDILTPLTLPENTGAAQP